jgi:hypothetical protein
VVDKVPNDELASGSFFLPHPNSSVLDSAVKNMINEEENKGSPFGEFGDCVFVFSKCDQKLRTVVGNFESFSRKNDRSPRSWNVTYLRINVGM